MGEAAWGKPPAVWMEGMAGSDQGSGTDGQGARARVSWGQDDAAGKPVASTALAHLKGFPTPPALTGSLLAETDWCHCTQVCLSLGICAMG